MNLRGCGTREEGSLYFVCETSPFGMPIEHYLIDPPIIWDGPKLRAPMIQRDKFGINHILIGVGAKFYPFIPDFVEEARAMGVSKKIPRGFDLLKLTAGRSKMVLIHPRAIPNFDFVLFKREPCPRFMERVPGHNCIKNLWPLSALKAYKHVHEIFVSGSKARIKTPSVRYSVKIPRLPKLDTDCPYLPGLFLRVPITRIDYINPKGRVPKPIKERVKESGFKLEVLPE